MDINITAETDRICDEIISGRRAAHRKHGDNSIEATHWKSGKWLPILIEEVGELAHEQTYDARVDVFDGKPLTTREQEIRQREAMRAELLDVATVAVAWIAAIDRVTLATSNS